MTTKKEPVKQKVEAAEIKKWPFPPETIKASINKKIEAHNKKKVKK